MIWYPYQQMKTMKAPYEIIDAEGRSEEHTSELQSQR